MESKTEQDHESLFQYWILLMLGRMEHSVPNLLAKISRKFQKILNHSMRLKLTRYYLIITTCVSLPRYCTEYRMFKSI